MSQADFEKELFLLAKQRLGMPDSVAKEYVRGWLPFYHEELTPQAAIEHDIAQIGDPNKDKTPQRRAHA